MARQVKIRDLNPVGKNPYGVVSRYNEYKNLLGNAVSIVNKDGSPLPFDEEAYAKNLLIENGQVGYSKITKKWYSVRGEGRNEIGNPEMLVLTNAKDQTMCVRACYDKDVDGSYRILAYPFGFSIGQMIRETTDFMTNCDIAMRQNLEACKTPYVIVCKDEDLRLSVEQSVQKKILGQAVIVVSPELGEGMKSIDVSSPYLIDKFRDARDAERDVLLNKFGILTSNDTKKERIQSAEVNATIGQATDYIYLLIDTFNHQMESYDLSFEMVFNGSMEDLYTDKQGEPTTPASEVIDVNEIEKGNENDD